MLLNGACSIQMKSPHIQASFGISVRPICRILMDCSDYHLIGMLRSRFHDGLKMDASRSFSRLCSCLPVNLESQGSNNMLIDLDFESKNEERGSLFDTDDAANCPAEEDIETERRRKIGLANKGRIPWNKGRPHSPETRERIKQRTIEAMRDPKVRKKMSEYPRRHSDQVKTKISSSLKQLWAERLKRKHAKEKLYNSWAENIAEAAKKGGVNEDELRWDSYDKMKREIALRNLEHAIEKAKAKEGKRSRAGRKAPKRAKRVRVSQRLAENKNIEAPIKRPRKKNQNPNEVEEELNLKTRLTKIQRKKFVNGQASSQMPAMVSCYPSLERLDLRFIEREMTRMKVSLEDEIRAAKNRRNGSTGCEALTTSFRLEE